MEDEICWDDWFIWMYVDSSLWISKTSCWTRTICSWTLANLLVDVCSPYRSRIVRFQIILFEETKISHLKFFFCLNERKYLHEIINKIIEWIRWFFWFLNNTYWTYFIDEKYFFLIKSNRLLMLNKHLLYLLRMVLEE